MAIVPTIRSVKLGSEWAKKLEKLSAYKFGVKVGILDGATYDNGTPVALVAYLNEYGSKHNPARPFMKKTFRDNIQKWVGGIKTNIKGKIFNESAVRNAYEMCGLVAAGDMKRTIADWPSSDPRPNDPKTIKRKMRRGKGGRNLRAIDPYAVLKDTGTMMKAIDFEVE